MTSPGASLAAWRNKGPWLARVGVFATCGVSSRSAAAGLTGLVEPHAGVKKCAWRQSGKAVYPPLEFKLYLASA